MNSKSERQTTTPKAKPQKIKVSPTTVLDASVMEISNFKGEHSNAVVVLVVSAQGTEQFSFIKPVGNDLTVDTDDNSMIVIETPNIKYLDQRKEDPKKKVYAPLRGRAIRIGLIAVADSHFTEVNAESPLLYKGGDFRKILSDGSKTVKADYREENPLDEHTEEELAKPKAQRRRLKPAKGMPSIDFDADLKTKCPEAFEGRLAYNKYAKSDPAIALANAASPITTYSPRYGPRADQDQRLSLVVSASPDLSAHDAIIMKLTEAVTPPAARA